MFWWTERTDINTNLRLFFFRICCMFAFNFKKQSPFYEFSFLQYDDHLLQIMPALQADTGGWALSRCGLVETGAVFGPPQDPMGSEKNVGHFCQIIIPSSHHLIPSSPVPSSHHLWSHHPIIRNMFQNHHPIWHWALLIGGVTGCPWFGPWRRRVWKPNLSRIRGDVGNPPWI